MYKQSNKLKISSDIKWDFSTWEKIYKRYKISSTDTEVIREEKEKLFYEKCRIMINEGFDRIPVKSKRVLTNIEIKNRKQLLEELLEQEYGDTK